MEVAEMMVVGEEQKPSPVVGPSQPGAHPEYGPVLYQQPLPVYYKKKGELVRLPNYLIELFDDKAKPCIVYHKGKGRHRPVKLHQNFTFSTTAHRTFRVHQIMLASAFRHIPPKAHVDHINDDPFDHRIWNLQWLSASENSRKGQLKSCKVEQKGKAVMMLEEDPKTGEMRELMRFGNVTSAAKLIFKYDMGDRGKGHLITPQRREAAMAKLVHALEASEEEEVYHFLWRAEDGEIVMYDRDEYGIYHDIRRFPNLPTLVDFIMVKGYDMEVSPETCKKQINSMASKIMELLRGNGKANRQSYRGYYWKAVEMPKIEGEEWCEVPAFITPVPGYRVSSKGRVTNLYGILSPQCPSRYGKYKTVTLQKSARGTDRVRWYVHRLVWAAFNGPIPEGYDVMHEDDQELAPLGDDGYYRNYLEDLNPGTRSENMISFHAAKKAKKGSSSSTTATIQGRSDDDDTTGVDDAAAAADDDDDPNDGEVVADDGGDNVKDWSILPHLNFSTRKNYKFDGPEDMILYLMQTSPTGINVKVPYGKHNLGFEITRKYSTISKRITSTRASIYSDRVKFMQILEAYIYVGNDVYGIDYDYLVGLLSKEEKDQLRRLPKLVKGGKWMEG